MILREFSLQMRFLPPLVLSLLPLLAQNSPPVLAIRNARIVTVSGPVIAKGTVVIRNGLIEAVGDNVQPPPDAWLLEGEGLTVYPGLIDALSSVGIGEIGPQPMAGGRGLVPPSGLPAGVPSGAPNLSPPARGPEDRPLTNSWIRAADLIRPTERRVEAMRNGGYTSSVSFPQQGIFAGQGAVINLAPEGRGRMIVEANVGQMVTLQRGGFVSFPGSVMGTIAYIRQVYLDAEQYAQAKAIYEKHPQGLERPAYDRALEGVLDAKRVLMPAAQAHEITRMIRFAQELKVPQPVLYGAHQAYKQADAIAAAKLPVLVSLKWPEAVRDANPDLVESMATLELRDMAPSSPAALAKAGVQFAFYSDGIDRPLDLIRAVRRSIEKGLDSQAALKAMTLAPAQIFGVANRVGSIEAGKIANLLVTKGDLFVERPQIQHVFVDGIKFDPPPPAPPTPAAPPSLNGAAQEEVK